MLDMITLRSTQKGYVGTYISGFTLAAFSVLVSMSGWYYQNIIYTKYSIISFWAIDNLALQGKIPDYIGLLIVLTAFAKWLGIIIAFSVAYAIILVVVYDTRQTMVLRVSSDGKSMIVISAWNFFWTENQQSEVFDGFVTLQVKQRFWDKILNTGTIVLDTIAYIHTEKREKIWEIPAIIYPHEAKEWILKNIPRYGYGTQLQLN